MSDQRTLGRLVHLIRNDREELLAVAAEPMRAPAIALSRLKARLRGESPVAYIGWIGHRNLGDEVMYQVIRRAFSQFSMTHFQPPPGEKLLARIGLGGTGFFRVVLLGGGTLINPLHLEAVSMARRYGAKIFSLGTGVGSPGFGMPHDVTLDGWRQVLAGTRLGVRGPLSQLALRKVGIAHAEVIGDPALGMTSEQKPAPRTRRRLVINLASEAGGQHRTLLYPMFRGLAGIARRFLDTGGELIGVALGSGDRQILSGFRKHYSLNEMVVEDCRESGEEFLRMIAGSVALVGVRLHAVVLSACAGVPSIALAYRGKCNDFMESMGLGRFVLPFCETTLEHDVNKLWDRVLAEENLGDLIHARAVAWKKIQDRFYREVIAAI